MVSSRVALREHTLEDLEPYCDWQMDPEVATHVSWLPRTRAESHASLLDAIAQQHAEPRTRYFFAVVLRDSGEVIGDVGFTVTAPRTADCGWFLRRRYWGQGYGAEAVHQLIDYTVSQAKLELLTASCAAQNVRSVRIMEVTGFTLVRQSESRRWYELRVPDLAKRTGRMDPV